MMHGFGFGNFGTFGWIGMVLNLVITIGLFGGIIWLVVWAVKRVTSNNSQQIPPFGQHSGYQTPKEILQARYARGEITREQYHEILEDLA